MFRSFAPFRLFDLFRVPSGETSDAPSIAISETGLMTVTCQTSAAPRLTVSETGLVTWADAPAI